MCMQNNKWDAISNPTSVIHRPYIRDNSEIRRAVKDPVEFIIDTVWYYLWRNTHECT